jgi:hypothetical protein
MTDDRILIDRLEFYITNVCNLTCSNCNRYNNYKFSGWQRWDDYADILTEWAKRIDIRHPVILGGEPLLNPDINKWITGINCLWPAHAGVQILSNGTRINQVSGLYDTLINGNWIGITVHSRDDLEEIISRIRQFLVHPIREFKDPSLVGSDYSFIDANGKFLHVWISDKFVSSNLIQRSDGVFEFYNSNPDIAHENCTFRRFKNYHMIRGKIYKCGPVALMPEFAAQHKFDLNNEDIELLNSYHPLAVDEFDTRGLEFFDTIDNVIPQCKFCPEQYKTVEISFTDLKKSWKINKNENTA